MKRSAVLVAAALFACAPHLRSEGAAPQAREIAVRKSETVRFTDKGQVATTGERGAVTVAFSYVNPCQLKLDRARATIHADTISVEPAWNSIRFGDVCPDVYLVESYEAVVDGIQAGTYVVRIYAAPGRDGSRMLMFPEVRVTVP
jgi:hypothetical protein